MKSRPAALITGTDQDLIAAGLLRLRHRRRLATDCLANGAANGVAIQEIEVGARRCARFSPWDCQPLEQVPPCEPAAAGDERHTLRRIQRHRYIMPGDLRSWPRRFAELLGLHALTVAQPVLALTTDSPEFFSLRKSPDLAVVAFGVWLVVGIPIVLLAAERLAAAMRQAAGWALHLAVVCVYLSLLALMVLERLDTSLSLRVGVDAPGWGLMVVALGVAGLCTWFFRNSPPAHAYLRLLGLAAPVVLVVFLLRAPLGGAALPAPARAERPVPVVLVVFDELPTASLLGAGERIDARRMPTFARLAETSVWFSSATTVADETFRAVPAILAGRRPSERDRPSLRDWPENLFTLLRGQYAQSALEPVTRLCQRPACGARSPGALEATGSLIADSGRLAAKSAAPADLEDHLPPVLGEQGALEDPSDDVDRFLAKLGRRDRPSLSVLHIMLPHHPWRYLPDGRRYPTRGEGLLPPGFETPVWTTDARVVRANWRRHLLQAGYADAVLAKILGRLRRLGTFERSLVIVTADHGISFEPGKEMRHATGANLAAVASVPLFVKRPYQRRGARTAAAAETSDILPTILEVLDAGPIALRRRSLLSAPRTPRRVGILSSYGPTVRAPVGAILDQRRAILREQAALLRTPYRGR